VVEWESLLAGTSCQALAQAGESSVLADVTNDGCYVFVLSERLTRGVGSSAL
jgi:hypothetical protein